MTPMGSEPTTFQLVVQYRNQMHHQEPLITHWCLVKYLVTIHKVKLSLWVPRSHMGEWRCNLHTHSKPQNQAVLSSLLHIWPLCPHSKSPQYPLNRTVGGPHSQCGCTWEEKIQEIKPWSLECPAHGPVLVPTTLLPLLATIWHLANQHKTTINSLDCRQLSGRALLLELLHPAYHDPLDTDESLLCAWTIHRFVLAAPL